MALLKLFMVYSVTFLMAATPAQPIKIGNATPASPPTDFAIFRYDWNRTGVTPLSSNIATPHERWTYATSAVFTTRPLAADVNKDGKLEIFFGEIKWNNDPRNIYALNSNGNLLWTYQVKWDAYATAVADLDGDGVPEIVLSEYAFSGKGGLSIYVANANTGMLIWKYTDVTTFWEEGFFASPVIYDVNGDGVKDVTVGSLDRYVYTFSGKDGSVLWQSPIFDHYLLASSPLVDLNGDGEMDFVAVDNHAVARAYSIKTHTLLWEQTVGYGVEATPAIGDVDGDGLPEVVFSLIDSGGIRVLNNDGSLLWVSTVWPYFYTSPTLVDVDGDGLVDVVNMDSIDHTAIAFRGTDGVELWHTVLPNTTWSQAAMVTADIDGDAKPEVLAGSDIGLYSLDAKTGKIEWLFPADRIRREPRIADIDADGKAEIVLGAGDGRLHVLDQAPEPHFDPRTIGYWKHQCTIGAPKGGDHVGMKQSFIDAIRNQSRVFSTLGTVAEACGILWADYKSDMAGRARQQLLALWLNVVAGFVDLNAPIHLPKLTSATTVGGAILDAENLILTHTDKPSLERAKNICDSLNNGRR